MLPSRLIVPKSVLSIFVDKISDRCFVGLWCCVWRLYVLTPAASPATSCSMEASICPTTFEVLFTVLSVYCPPTSVRFVLKSLLRCSFSRSRAMLLPFPPFTFAVRFHLMLSASCRGRKPCCPLRSTSGPNHTANILSNKGLGAVGLKTVSFFLTILKTHFLRYCLATPEC